ncbi:ww domain binding protein 4 (formin binding protein 21) [Plasmopara halstedii]|uniref:Ww domain binding protein 4 (Formin binding protein 21) n=1 Tax=Plasmopara halstedii TaxID=4781 RepID=A0A0P1B1H4_PLAHL|nr:ww domain binding protein 4 (formin binding protein 21) [Plasmopara halstedii]CEG48277.1 ww domain binding protein 4 (formin binding protein 21) [Plasmopara halstedii]|eukprot:XP_024584646.1 ww domain binding protein 4 (formin binding protein 21) [Plasmopara halstedii]
MANRHAPSRSGQRSAPPPPPRRPNCNSVTNQSPPYKLKHISEVEGIEAPNQLSSGGQYYPLVQLEEPVKKEEDDRGVYAVRGIVYLEGKKHDSQLEAGSTCQIWVEEVEKWLDALVEQAAVHTIPNTDGRFRCFTVMYMLPVDTTVNSGTTMKPIVEREVLADRLRIPMPIGVSLESAEKMVDQWRTSGGAAYKGTKPFVAIDETTGMGEWNTVEVRQIDESPDAVARLAAEAEVEAQRTCDEQERLNALEDMSSQGDNALGAYNPWGGTYKGVNIDDASTASALRRDEINITSNGNVSFKKREKRHKRRRIHTENQ